MNVQCTYERVKLERLKYGIYAVSVDVIKKRAESNLTNKVCSSCDEPKRVLEEL